MRSTGERRAWWRPTDHLVYVLGFTALIVYALHGFDGFLRRDSAIYSYAGQQVAEGVPPYLGILNRAGPLAHVIPAIGVGAARVGGFEDLFGIRLLFLVISVACVCVLYALARDLFASRLAGLVAATAFLTFQGFIEYATNGPREKTPMVLFLLCALLAVAKRRWFAAGISASLIALIWQPAFLVGLTAAIVALIALRSSARVPALLRFVVGALVPTSLFVIYFAVTGTLREFIDAYLVINARYTIPNPPIDRLSRVWSKMQGGYGVSAWVIVIGLAALAILSFREIGRGNWKTQTGISIVALSAASLVGLAWSARDFNSWPDAFTLLPLAAIGVGGIAKELIERLSARAALALTLAWVVAAVAIAATYSTTDRNHELDGQHDLVAAVLERLSSDASILSIGAPEPLVLSGITNPTRHQTFKRGLDRYVDDTYPGGLRGFGMWVGRNRPTIIAVDGARPPWWLLTTIETDYRRLGRAPGWTWFVSRSVSPDIAIDLRRLTSAAQEAHRRAR